jgi:hypothetical protein
MFYELCVNKAIVDVSKSKGSCVVTSSALLQNFTHSQNIYGPFVIVCNPISNIPSPVINTYRATPITPMTHTLKASNRRPSLIVCSFYDREYHWHALTRFIDARWDESSAVKTLRKLLFWRWTLSFGAHLWF